MKDLIKTVNAFKKDRDLPEASGDLVSRVSRAVYLGSYCTTDNIDEYR